MPSRPVGFSTSPSRAGAAAGKLLVGLSPASAEGCKDRARALDEPRLRRARADGGRGTPRPFGL